MNTFLHSMELRKLFPIMTGIVIMLLAAVTSLGIKQYLLYQHCEEMLARSNQIIFQFTSIKEHVNDSLVTGKAFNIQETSQELLGFDKDLKEIIDDILIPEEFKLSFISQVDLMSLVVQLRTIMDDTAPPSPDQGAKLTASLRSISNRLLAFHDLLSGHTRSLLLGLYKVIVGTLALIIFFTSTMLLLINRFIAVPIVHLCSMTDNTGEEDENTTWKTSTLRASIQSLTSYIVKEKADKKQLEDLRICLENTLQTLPDRFTSQDDWETLCAALQTNPNYFLVWAGQHSDDSRFPENIIGDGCVSCSPSQCRQTIEQLVEFCYQEGGLCDTAKKAMQQGTRVIAETPYDVIPENLRRSLSLDKQPILSASFPITGPTQTVDTVITVYSPRANSFHDLEISVLQLLCEHISHIRLPQATAESTDDKIPADLYRFAVAGELSTSLAHEIINISNGALNYSQALVDLTADDQKKGEEHLLLEKLHGEEQKIARLAADFNQLVNLDGSMPQKISIQKFFQRIQHLLQGKLRQQNIKLHTITDKNVPEVIAPLTLLQIVILTLLHEAESYIQTLSVGDRKNIITMAGIAGKTQTPELLITISPLHTDIETDVYSEAVTAWPPIAICRHMMHSFQGDLTFDMNTDEHATATLTVPLQVKRDS